MRDTSTQLDTIERFLQQEGAALLARPSTPAPCDALRTAKRARAQSRSNAPETERNAIDAYERLVQALRQAQEHAPR